MKQKIFNLTIFNHLIFLKILEKLIIIQIFNYQHLTKKIINVNKQGMP